MTALEPVMLAITEDALTDLAITYSRQHTLISDRPAHRDRSGHRDLSTADTTVADRTACWLRMVSITEIHAENLLRHLDHGTRQSPPRTWPQIKECLRNSHHIDVAALGSAADLEACFLVRNAIAHGLGRFTDNQLRPKRDGTRTDLRRPLRSIGVNLRDGAVAITPNALTRCHDTCRTFITALDNQREQSPPPRYGGLYLGRAP